MGQPLKLLAVDDDAPSAELVVRVAERCGYEAFATSDSRGALNLVAALRPDVMAVDISMPHVDAIELFRLLAEQRYGGEIIIVSGQDEQTLRVVQKSAELMACADPGFIRSRSTSPDCVTRSKLGSPRQVRRVSKGADPGPFVAPLPGLLADTHCGSGRFWPQYGLHLTEQTRQIDRLGIEVYTTGGQCIGTIGFERTCRQRDDRQGRRLRVGANAACGLAAIHFPQTNVHQDHIRQDRLCRGDATRTIFGKADGEASALQPSAQHIAIDRIVFNDEDDCHVDAPLRVGGFVAGMPARSPESGQHGFDLAGIQRLHHDAIGAGSQGLAALGQN